MEFKRGGREGKLYPRLGIVEGNRVTNSSWDSQISDRLAKFLKSKKDAKSRREEVILRRDSHQLELKARDLRVRRF